MVANILLSNQVNMDDIDEDFIPARRITRQTYKSRWLRPIPRLNNKHRITKSPPSGSEAKKAISRIKGLLQPTKKQEKRGSLFLTLLTQDRRFHLFDIIIGQETTVKMLPGLHPNGLLKSLSQASSKLSVEIKEWSQKRPDLVRSQTFGLYNPLVTSFDFSFFALGRLEQVRGESKVRRVYHPAAVVKYLEQLELWQRAMNKGTERSFCSGLIGAKAAFDYEYKGPEWSCNQRISSFLIDVDQHKQAGVRDVLVLDKMKYGTLENAKKAIEGWQDRLGWEDDKLAFVWTDDWDGFFEHRRVVEYED
ncbi:hypothetical protein BDZ45DRAFT_769667 [Acephala macrosclerotiorum]|nr:hypothetical protein BDZ45DRAFT_769667 [Acephala macrosclerotiorum]